MSPQKSAKEKEEWLDEIRNASVRMPRRMLFALARVSQRQGQTASAWVRSLIAPHLTEAMKAVDDEYLKGKAT